VSILAPGPISWRTCSGSISTFWQYAQVNERTVISPDAHPARYLFLATGPSKPIQASCGTAHVDDINSHLSATTWLWRLLILICFVIVSRLLKVTRVGNLPVVCSHHHDEPAGSSAVIIFSTPYRQVSFSTRLTRKKKNTRKHHDLRDR
jgi:hypothetical protein